MPTVIKITPLIIEIAFTNGFILLNADKNRFTDKELTKNGTARPIAYIKSNSAPAAVLCRVDAIKRMEASIGPIHGVQAAAKKTPIKAEPIKPKGLLFKLTTAS